MIIQLNLSDVKPLAEQQMHLGSPSPTLLPHLKRSYWHKEDSTITKYKPLKSRQQGIRLSYCAVTNNLQASAAKNSADLDLLPQAILG